MNNNYKFTPANLIDNICIDADSYKESHFSFMHPDTTSVFVYASPRFGAKFKEIVANVGFHIFLKEFARRRITMKMVNQASMLLAAHGVPFNREGFEYIVANHGGKFPVRIRAVEEGTVVTEGNIVFTIENTDPKCAWAANFIETRIMRAGWYGTTVATVSREYKKIIKKYLELSGDVSTLNYKLVDFGARGVSSKESAYIGGLAHLINFCTTDNLLGIGAAMQFYGINNVADIPGVSIPASEHSVTTERGRDGEAQFFSDAIDKFLTGPGTMVSLVSDTYDLANAIKIFGTTLKDKIIASGGTVVVRPDSGDPTEMVTFTVSELDKYFGSTVNEKGYKVLHPCIRVIQGDGIKIETIEPILKRLVEAGYSADNVTFGSGGGLLQSVTRDTERFAQKASYVVTGGVGMEIHKECVTDPTKASLPGRLTLVRRDGKIITIKENEMLSTDKELLKVVYENGKVYNRPSFATIRKNAEV